MQPPRRRSTADRLRLWPILVVLPLSFLVVLAGLVGLTLAAWTWLHHPALPRPRSLSLHDWIGVLQLVFASVAGAGALVALLVAYRRQRVAEADSAHDRTRVFNERFTTIAGQLGNSQAAVRLAGVHAMAGLADDWQENRRTCVDVLCAYLRMPYDPDPGVAAPPADRLAFGASREVRHSLIRVISAHLQPGASTSWQGLDLDFTDVQFDGGDFTGAQFSGGSIRFCGAQFSSGKVDFSAAQFSGANVDFGHSQFSGGTVSFGGAKFSGGKVDFGYRSVYFGDAQFSGADVNLAGAQFTRGMVRFGGATFSGGIVNFGGAHFVRGMVRFGGAHFAGGTVDFGHARFSGGSVRFGGGQVTGGIVRFAGAKFSGSSVYFGDAQFSGGTVDFAGAKFAGGMVRFGHARFSGGTVDLSRPSDWSRPPTFSFTGTPPPGVLLPPRWTP